jgi:hypothetical protein
MKTYKLLNVSEIDLKCTEKEINESVYLHSSNYSKIFGTTLSNKLGIRGVVRIVNIDTNGEKNTIYRSFASKGIKDLGNDTIGLSFSSCRYLGIEDFENANFILKKGNKLFFYWQHPLHEIRIAFKIGILSVFLGLISILISILPLIT